MYVTMSISMGLYPNLDLWNANKFTLHYITLHCDLKPKGYMLNPITHSPNIQLSFYLTMIGCNFLLPYVSHSCSLLSHLLVQQSGGGK